MSETKKCRERLAKFCIGNGLDLGYGGDPIVPSAITIDLEKPYAYIGSAPQNLKGDATNLFWFKDECLDYIYSSHLLEDFPREQQKDVLREWLRVLKPGGKLIIFCPNEKVYREHCRNTGQVYNTNHSEIDFSLRFLKNILNELGIGYKIIHEIELIDTYSFDLVIEKE